MKVLLVHPNGLMYTEVYLRLEPLGLELVAEACRKAGHEVRLLDLQVFRHQHYEMTTARRRTIPSPCHREGPRRSTPRISIS
jgi:magnesium-protoporphyrin IX monomethyl ester (oxidative) cyclase